MTINNDELLLLCSNIQNKTTKYVHTYICTIRTLQYGLNPCSIKQIEKPEMGSGRGRGTFYILVNKDAHYYWCLRVSVTARACVPFWLGRPLLGWLSTIT